MNTLRVSRVGPVLACTAFGSALLFAAQTPLPATPSAPFGYGASVTVLAGTRRPDGVRFVVRVTNLKSEDVVAGADLTVAAGETATSRSEGPPEAPQVLVAATLSQDRKTGRYEVTVQERGVVASRVQGELRLPLQ